MTAQFVTQFARKPLVAVTSRSAIAIFANDADVTTLLQRPRPAGQLWERLTECSERAS